MFLVYNYLCKVWIGKWFAAKLAAQEKTRRLIMLLAVLASNPRQPTLLVLQIEPRRTNTIILHKYKRLFSNNWCIFAVSISPAVHIGFCQVCSFQKISTISQNISFKKLRSISMQIVSKQLKLKENQNITLEHCHSICQLPNIVNVYFTFLWRLT